MRLEKKGLGLINDLQNEHNIVRKFRIFYGERVRNYRYYLVPVIAQRNDWVTEQKPNFIFGRQDRKVSFTFGLTEQNHGSDATHMSTRATRMQNNGVNG